MKATTDADTEPYWCGYVRVDLMGNTDDNVVAVDPLTIVFGPRGGRDSLTSIENVEGSPGNDEINGDNYANRS